jgi:mitochondrial fission protein ELM1
MAPFPWNFSDANELVIATESVSAVSVAVSDGTPIITLSIKVLQLFIGLLVLQPHLVQVLYS